MKKIIFYLCGIYNGGTEIATLNLMKNLNREVYDLYYCYGDQENGYMDMLKKYNQVSTYIDFNIKQSIQFDTIIYCTEANKDIETIIKNIHYKKGYFWYHYIGFGQEEFANYAYEKKYIDQVITVSEYANRAILELIKNKSIPVKVIPNILDSEMIIKKGNEPILLEKGRNLTLVTVARFAPIKGYHRVKCLADFLIEENIDFKWYVLGKGSNPKEHNEVVELLQPYTDKIVMVGHKDNPYNYIKNSDYLVLLSSRETSGLVITEAKIIGTPCIVTNFDAVYEQIEDNKNGIILDREDLESYKGKIKDIIEKKHILKQNLSNFIYPIEELKKEWEKIL